MPEDVTPPLSQTTGTGAGTKGKKARTRGTGGIHTSETPSPGAVPPGSSAPETIPYVRDLEVEYGRCDHLSPLIRRVTANNPGGFTFKGTGTYIVGQGTVAVIDPGPADPTHLSALLAALEGETVSHILITHTHMDHSPLAAELKARTGAPTFGYGPHADGIRDDAERAEGADWDFVPDHALRHGDEVTGPGWNIEAVFTPGHTSNHLCLALGQEKALFSGDHVMGWSTSVISPPDGNMKDYFASLALLLERDDAIYWPTHGPAITGPKTHVRAFIAHRRQRETQIMQQIHAGNHTISAMVPVMYARIDKRLHKAAERSVYAHLVHMSETGRVVCEGTPEMETVYRLP